MHIKEQHKELSISHYQVEYEPSSKIPSSWRTLSQGFFTRSFEQDNENLNTSCLSLMAQKCFLVYQTIYEV